MFSKINCSKLYLTQSKDYKNFTIHTTNADTYAILIEKIKTECGLDLSSLIPLKQQTKFADIDWENMPEYIIEPEMLKTLQFSIHYTDTEILDKIIKIMNYPKVTNRSCWYPERLVNIYKDKKVISKSKINPKYPIYIISKGRYNNGTTAKYLDECDIDYKLVVEPDEYDLYVANYNPAKILVCPENFSSRGQGGIPVRNFVWEHSIQQGAKRHWILDDNIKNYFRHNRGQKNKIYSGAIFRMIEDYTDRYTNVKMSGHNYSFFNVNNPYPIIKNTRIYSSILLSNDIYPEFAWRGRYNEDTDLSLRLLKANYCTLLFNNITANKSETMTTKGGNTDTIYAVKNAHLNKSKELVDNHPDCAVVKIKFGRQHHEVDYTIFKHLIPAKKPIIDSIDYELEYI
jgi:hypothetical protein